MNHLLTMKCSGGSKPGSSRLTNITTTYNITKNIFIYRKEHRHNQKGSGSKLAVVEANLSMRLPIFGGREFFSKFYRFGPRIDALISKKSVCIPNVFSYNACNLNAL